MKSDRQIENETLICSSLQAPDGILASHSNFDSETDLRRNDGILDLAVAEFPLLG